MIIEQDTVLSKLKKKYMRVCTIHNSVYVHSYMYMWSLESTFYTKINNLKKTAKPMGHIAYLSSSFKKNKLN